MKLILLIHSPSQAQQLTEAAPRISALKPSAIWVVYSPSAIVDVNASHAEIDRKIAGVNEAIRDAVAREQFKTADDYKQQREALVLQKSASASSAHTTMTKEEREASAKRVFGPFWELKPAPRMALEAHVDHYETTEWITMVNSLKGRWPAEMAHGEFLVGWPGQFLDSPAVAALPDAPKPAAPVVAPEPTKERKPTVMESPRYKFLSSIGLDALGQEAMKIGLTPSGSKKQIVFQILKKEKQIATTK